MRARAWITRFQLKYQRRLMIARWLLTFIAFVLLANVFHQHLQSILNWMNTLGSFAPCLFLLLYCLMSIFCLPNVLLALAGGALFGLVAGTLLNLCGATLGAMCGFCLSRYCLPRRAVVLDEHTRMQRLLRHVGRKGWKSVALLRLTPAMPYNLVNYGLGVTTIKFTHYILATFVFLIPNKVILTYCGYAGVNLLG
jgi:uncharacterized membrane protein YdjX (TVP38/TMEM64 family)